jgi:hypothetical protein
VLAGGFRGVLGKGRRNEGRDQTIIAYDGGMLGWLRRL